MTTLLTDNLPIVASAPNGVKKIRDLILQLAVMGKLLPQDPNDEPARKLLQRARQKLLRKSNDIREEKPAVEVKQTEKIFSLSPGWEWTRLGYFCQVKGGKRLPAGAAFSNQPTPYIYIRVTNMKGGSITSENLTFISEEIREKIKPYTISHNDLYITIAGTIGAVGSVPAVFDGMNLTENAAKIVFEEVSRDWLRLCLSSNLLQQQFVDKTNTLAQPKLALHRIADSVLAVPPLAEQQRIVAKVDELMALSDRLEAQQADAESAHTLLVKTLLDSLTQSSKQADFVASWDRIKQNFETLFTTEASVNALKQALLQLAVMGKLVPQDLNDEPADYVLSKIRAELRQIPGKKSLAEWQKLSVDAGPFSLPSGWQWTSIGEIADVGTGKTPSREKPEYYGGTIPWVSSGLTGDSYITGTNELITEAAVKECTMRIYPKHTLIVAMYGQGKTRGQISELLIDATVNQACAAIVLHGTAFKYNRFIKLCFEKSYDEIRELSAGGAQPNLNVEKIKQTPIPMPPIDEQHRIVAKVDDLMELCDRVRDGVVSIRACQELLAATLIQRALNGKESPPSRQTKEEEMAVM